MGFLRYLEFDAGGIAAVLAPRLDNETLGQPIFPGREGLAVNPCLVSVAAGGVRRKAVADGVSDYVATDIFGIDSDFGPCPGIVTFYQIVFSK